MKVLAGSAVHEAGSVRRILRVCVLFAITLTLASCPSHQQRAPSNVSLQGVMPLIKDARLIQSVSFDGGSLTLDPAPTPPQITEQHALTLWEAAEGEGNGSPTSDAVVFLANATSTLPISRQVLTSKDASAPAFTHRPAWIFMWDFTPVSCIGLPGNTQPARPPISMELIAADGTGEGIFYTTRGAVCPGPEGGPVATIAEYWVSLAWKVAQVNGRIATIRIPLSHCGREGSSGAVLDHTSHYLLAYSERIYMQHAPCDGDMPSMNIVEPTPPFGAASWGKVKHAPTGLTFARTSSKHGLLYFDGVEHSVHPPSI